MPAFVSMKSKRIHYRLPCTIAVDVDFHNRTSTITAGNNCTSISTVDDVNYERNKVFTVTVAPRESDDKEIGLSYSVVLQDNDGECKVNVVAIACVRYSL